MWLTGVRGGPPLQVAQSVTRHLDAWAMEIEQHSMRRGRHVRIDGPALLGERAAIAGYRRNGRISCGGASRLIAAADGWLAVTLARDDDIASIPAWLEAGEPLGDPWGFVESHVAHRTANDVRDRAVELGIPCSRVGEVTAPADPVIASQIEVEPPARSFEGRTVVDLSSMWAGPLCANLLGLAGMRVVKVESATRPDGARRGPAAFFELLHSGHEFVSFDFRSPRSVDALRALIQEADVVIEASRPRALRHLGLHAEQLLSDSDIAVWLSITGFGRSGPDAARVGFGDDAAAAGGLVAWHDGQPCFVADAAADPATGLLGAAAVMRYLASGGQWLVDVSLARTAATLAAGELPRDDVPVAAVALPRARPIGRTV